MTRAGVRRVVRSANSGPETKTAPMQALAAGRVTNTISQQSISRNPKQSDSSDEYKDETGGGKLI